MSTNLDGTFLNYSLVYQPQIRFDSSDSDEYSIYGAEALLRVPGGKPALDAIVQAEEAGTMIELGKWILRQACLQAARWAVAGKSMRVSVNISPVQLQDQNFPSTIAGIVEETGIQAGSLALEISERYFSYSIHESLETYQAIKEIGVELILDNFGTRYAWLPSLRNLPFDSMKIARAFVADIATNPGDEAVVRAIVGICRDKGISVIATGVETTVQRDVLLRLGCRTQQGFLYGDPQPIGGVIG